jgi:E3 ubiquitin-protein ligase NEDD4
MENPESSKDKLSYCRSIAKALLIDEVEHESAAFLSGFFEVIPRVYTAVFTESELDYLICGCQNLSLEDWKANTVYKGEFSKKHRVIKWFWEYMDTLS